MKRILRKIKRNKEDRLDITLTDNIIKMEGVANIKRLMKLRKTIDELINNIEQEQLEEER